MCNNNLLWQQKPHILYSVQSLVQYIYNAYYSIKSSVTTHSSLQSNIHVYFLHSISFNDFSHFVLVKIVQTNLRLTLKSSGVL